MANIRTLADLNSSDSTPAASAFPNPWASGGGGQAVGGQSMTTGGGAGGNVHGPVSYLSDFGYGVQSGDVAIMYGEEVRPMSTLTPGQICCASCCNCCVGPLCTPTRKALYKRNATSMIGATSIVQILLLIITLFPEGFADREANPSLGPPGQVLYNFGAKDGPAIASGQIWRLVTPIMLHAGIWHLLFNMWAQLRIGFFLTREWGTQKLAVVYWTSGIAGNLLSLVLQPTTRGVGASGALLGLIGAWMAYMICTWEEQDPRVRKLMLGQLVFTTLITFMIGLGSELIDDAAHLGGLLMGLALGFALFGSRVRKAQHVNRYVYGGRAVAFLMLTVLPIVFFTLQAPELRENFPRS